LFKKSYKKLIYIKKYVFFGERLEKVDLKDKKILYQLDTNSRQSATQIGKKIGLKRDFVQYRIKRLQEKGIIQNFYTVIDASKLGYSSFRFYFVFQYLTPKIQKDIITYFIKNKYTYFVGLIEGRYHLFVITWVKDVNEFYSFYQNILKKYGHYFKEINVCLFVCLEHYQLSFLQDNGNDRSKKLITGGQKVEDHIDKFDMKLLKIIALDARLPLIQIAEKLKTTTPVVKHHFNKLLKNGIIQGFKTNINFRKIGYQNYKVDIHLKDYNDLDKIGWYLTKNPYLYFVSKTAGYADLEVHFYAKNINKIHEIIEDLTNVFPGKIKYYSTFNILRYLKRQYMPEM
jgi:Lrp/AsnC family transcriptional regulator for asnA, asnC and gidA